VLLLVLLGLLLGLLLLVRFLLFFVLPSFPSTVLLLPHKVFVRQ
jgi:hypothetical protein